MKIYATLACDRCARATLHVFAERRAEAVVPGRKTFVRLIYECDRCGTMRVWGNEPRVPNRREAAWEADVFDHAVREHGMRRANCPVCRGLGVECDECDGRGWVWGFERLEPCHAFCPLAADGDRASGEPEPTEQSGDGGGVGDEETDAEETTCESDDAQSDEPGTTKGPHGRKGTGTLAAYLAISASQAAEIMTVGVSIQIPNSKTARTAMSGAGPVFLIATEVTSGARSMSGAGVPGRTSTE
jgi:hypothetical protein